MYEDLLDDVLGGLRVGLLGGDAEGLLLLRVWALTGGLTLRLTPLLLLTGLLLTLLAGLLLLALLTGVILLLLRNCR